MRAGERRIGGCIQEEGVVIGGFQFVYGGESKEFWCLSFCSGY